MTRNDNSPRQPKQIKPNTISSKARNVVILQENSHISKFSKK